MIGREKTMEQDGILVINKPAGMTSHDVVAKLRRVYRTKKVGHTGTLDPMVTGVMVIAFGKATKLVQFMMEESKVYRVGIKLGYATDTEDVTGTMTAKDTISESRSKMLGTQIVSALNHFIGTYDQVPPMYAAIKIRGKKLYEYARNNETVERVPRQLRIFAIDYENDTYQYDPSTRTSSFAFEVHGSKGLYARTLCVDIGKQLDVLATMETLTRTASGRYTLSDAVDLAEVLEQPRPLIPIKDVQLGYKRIYVASDVADKLRRGYKLPHYFVAQAILPDEVFTVYDENDKELIGLYKQSEKYADKYQSIRVM